MHKDKSMLEPFAIMELAAATGVIVAAIAGLVRQVEQSRCTTIDCCCITCNRSVPPPEQLPPGDEPPVLPQ